MIALLWYFRWPIIVLLLLGFALDHWWPQSARGQFAGAVAQDMCRAPHSCPTAPRGGAPGPVDGAGYSLTTWAEALLRDLAMAGSSENLRAIEGWEMAEGGHWHNTARFNPLNTTQPEPGSWPINSVGVQAYTSWAEGLGATVATLRNGLYRSILAALAYGNCGSCVAAAVQGSPWGTGRFAT